MAVTTTTAPLTLLQAVNEMLSGIGIAQVTTLDVANTNDDVGKALQELSNASVAIQESGWHFNTDNCFSFTPSVIDGTIEVPAAALKISLSERSQTRYMTMRQGKLWDLQNFTYNWTGNFSNPNPNPLTGDGNLYCDVVYGFVWEDLPQVWRTLILCTAARTFSVGRIPNEDTFKFNQTFLDNANAAAEQSDQDSRARSPSENPYLRMMRRR